MDRLFHKAKRFVANNVIKPAESLADIALKDMSHEEFTFHAKVPVKNPLCFTIPLGNLTYSFKTGGREIGSGTVEDPGSLEARAVTWLEVGVKIPFDIVVSLIRDVVDDWDIDYDMEVCLLFQILSLHNIPIPVTHVGTIKLPTMSDISHLLTGGGDLGGE